MTTTSDSAAPAVVLIHGLWVTARSWEPWIERYTARGYQVIANIAPASLTRANFDRYGESKAVTDFKEFPDRSHFTIGEPGWEAVADYALNWAARKGSAYMVASAPRSTASQPRRADAAPESR